MSLQPKRSSSSLSWEEERSPTTCVTACASVVLAGEEALLRRERRGTNRHLACSCGHALLGISQHGGDQRLAQAGDIRDHLYLARHECDGADPVRMPSPLFALFGISTPLKLASLAVQS